MQGFAVALFLIACAILYVIVRISINFVWKRDVSEKASKFDGPPTLPLIGNAHLFIGTTMGFMNKMLQLGYRYSSGYRVWLGNHLVIIVTTPEDMKTICQSQKTLHRGYLGKFLQPWAGTGLFTAPVPKWRVQRKLIQPTFNSSILRSFVEIFSARSEELAKQLEKHVDGSEFDIHKFVAAWSLETICETTMGVKLGAQTNDDCFHAKATAKMLGGVSKRIISPWLYPDFIFNNTYLGKCQQKYLKFMHKFTRDVIAAKQKTLSAGGTDSSAIGNKKSQSNPKPQREVFLDHLMKISYHGERLSDESLREEVDTMIVTGSDTTTTATCWLMLTLASHPHVQDKVYEELREIYGEDDSNDVHVTPEDLTRMSYLDRVIKETLRLFTITPMFIREVEDDIDIGGRIIPKGCSVGFGIIHIHRSEKYWPDPLKFDPDRFLPEEVAKRHPYAYIPFAGGARNCIGSQYATMTIKTLAATLIRRYVLKKDNIVPMADIKLKMEFLMRPVDPITLRIERRL